MSFVSWVAQTSVTARVSLFLPHITNLRVPFQRDVSDIECDRSRNYMALKVVHAGVIPVTSLSSTEKLHGMKSQKVEKQERLDLYLDI